MTKAKNQDISWKMLIITEIASADYSFKIADEAFKKHDECIKHKALAYSIIAAALSAISSLNIFYITLRPIYIINKIDETKNKSLKLTKKINDYKVKALKFLQKTLDCKENLKQEFFNMQTLNMASPLSSPCKNILFPKPAYHNIIINLKIELHIELTNLVNEYQPPESYDLIKSNVPAQMHKNLKIIVNIKKFFCHPVPVEIEQLANNTTEKMSEILDNKQMLGTLCDTTWVGHYPGE